MARKAKVKSYAALKRLLDARWSVLVRRRGTDSQGNCRCVSCPAVGRWQDMQCGHFIPRHYLAGRWHSDNCFVQCSGCNVFKRGNYPEFAAFIIKKYGPNMIECLLALKRQPVKLTRQDLIGLIEECKRKLDALDIPRFAG